MFCFFVFFFQGSSQVKRNHRQAKLAQQNREAALKAGKGGSGCQKTVSFHFVEHFIGNTRAPQINVNFNETIWETTKGTTFDDL